VFAIQSGKSYLIKRRGGERGKVKIEFRVSKEERKDARLGSYKDVFFEVGFR